MKTLLLSFRLSNTYGANTLIYRLRRLPVIKKILPSALYGAGGLKRFLYVLNVIFKTLFAFAGKFLYLWLMLLLPLSILPGDKTTNFVNVFFFLTVIGAFTNTELFNPTKAKYYTVILMRTDAKSYALSSLWWFLLKHVVTWVPAILILGLNSGIPLGICLLVPVILAECKLLGNAVMLRFFERTDYPVSENNLKLFFSIAGVGLLLAYGLPWIHGALPSQAMYGGAVLLLPFALLAFRYLLGSKCYKRLYKKILTPNNIVFGVQANTASMQQQTYLSKISSEEVHVGNKKGYDYFNELFIQRHRRILTHSARKTAYISLFVLAGVLLLSGVNHEASRGINRVMLNFLPYFIFVMYLINKGAVVTQAMFLNCDHSMLTYRFYRQPGTILQLFKVRLKTLIKINMIPAAVIACGLPLLLFATGGTQNPLNYLLLFVSILAMAVFFSVHHLVIYYLLQPYNVNMEAKSSTYSIVNGLTYFLCYMCIKFQAPTPIFASLTIVFSALYIGIALFLVYRYAPARFRLKQ
jgi:hypothetical protein